MAKKYKKLTDYDLMKLIEDENQFAIEELYRRCNFNMITNMITNKGGNKDDAKDIFQESFMVLYNKIISGNFTLSDAKFSTFIFRVAQNKWLKKYNYEKKIIFNGLISIKEDSEGNLFDVKIEKENLKFELTNIFKFSSEKCIDILKAFYFKNWSMEVIANRLKYKSAQVVKQLKYKCLENIKNSIKKIKK